VTKILSWNDIWERLDKDEQHQAVVTFIAWLQAPPSDEKQKYFDPLIRSLSKRIHFRVQSVQKMSAGQLAVAFKQHAYHIFDNDDWRALFTEYYMNNKCTLMCRFLDLCDIEHDERGGIDTEFEPPVNIDEITDILINEYGLEEVTTYYAVLSLHDPESWAYIIPALQGLISQQAQVDLKPQVSIELQPEEEDSPAHEMSEDFTQLDRVLIDQILATVAEEERGLTNSELVDLVETVHALDTSRKRSYFHLGFMDALLPEREPDFNRPEFNDDRRGWYLAGLLTGAARRRDSDFIHMLLKENNKYFKNSINRKGGSGATIMRSIYPFLIDEGLYAEAMVLLRGQAEVADIGSLEVSLDKATRLLQAGDTVRSSSLLSQLVEVLGRIPIDPDYRKHIEAKINRRRGQVMQMQGNFDAAKRLFDGLLDEHGAHNARLFADMGMVAGGFRQLSEVLVPNTIDRRQVMHDALMEGKLFFEEASEKYGSNAQNAQYALAVLYYLKCMNPEDTDGCTDSLRTKALDHINNALTGMTSSESLGVYEELGIIGRARFIQAVLLMGSLEPSQTRKAMAAWREIHKEAGMLPAWDVQSLIESAEMIDSEYAMEIGESIWSHRQSDALDIINSSNLITESDSLRSELLMLAMNDSGMGEETWSRWTLLIPALLKKKDVTNAEKGLDRLEDLAINGRHTEKMLEWLESPEHYEPAWSQEEMLRARFRLLRRLGRDMNAFEQLRELFFLLRDQRPEEANQVRMLFKDYGGDKNLYDDLILQNIDQDNSKDLPNVIDRLKSGERVSVLLIGGNEMQARYDEDIVQSLKNEWPGIEVKFEHTGWSSNWGREVNKLKILASQCQAVVLMTMMRTMLGRTMRSALNDPPRPWIPCTGTGKKAIKDSIRKAAIIGLQQSEKGA